MVCGHIHHAEIRDIGGVTYFNCGDWVESCTALAEDMDGKIHLIRWVTLDHLNQSPKPPLLKAVPKAKAA